MCLEINGEVYCAVLINCLKFFLLSALSRFMHSTSSRQVDIFSSLLSAHREDGDGCKKKEGFRKSGGQKFRG